MCGIGGIVRLSGLASDDRERIKRLRDQLLHRGPDGNGIWADDVSVFAQTRLAIVDLNTHSLPLVLNDRYVLLFNGEIYNHRTLRQELANDHHFQTRTDTEVLGAAWIRWGSKVVDHLEGMYAFAIWDTQARSLFAARDPVGVKPFFYSLDSSRLAFGSEPQALVKSGIARATMNKWAIAETLTAPFFSGAQQTPFADIQILSPGSALAYQDGRATLTRFFEYSHEREGSVSLDDLDFTLKEAVHNSIDGETEVGLFLSGGLDSTLIGALMDRPQKKAWTINYIENENANYDDSLIVKSADLPFAKMAAQQFGFERIDVQIDRRDYTEGLSEALESNDLIAVWEQEISQHLLAKAASKVVKAVIVGDAADETHFGYPFLVDPNKARSPLALIDFFGAIPMASDFFRGGVADFDNFYRMYSEERGYSWEREPVLAMSRLAVDFWLPRLLYNGDKHLMNHSLEGRVPFALPSVLKLARGVLPIMATKDGVEKWHLRKVAERYLSNDLAWRPKSALTKNLNGKFVLIQELQRQYRENTEILNTVIDETFLKRLVSTKNPTDRDGSQAFRILGVLNWMRSYQ